MCGMEDFGRRAAAIDKALAAISRAVVNPDYHAVLSVVKGFRNGMVYGTKVRFTNALVMALLFGSGRLLPRLWRVVDATKSHAVRLGTHVAIVKATLVLLSVLQGGPTPRQALVGGFIGGWIVWGDESPLAEQVNLYLMSRVLLGLVRLLQKQAGHSTPPHSFRLFAAIVWALSAGLFFTDASLYPSGLSLSMEYLYRDSERWTSLRTLLWHNR
eukprot:EG_transcript_18667